MTIKEDFLKLEYEEAGRDWRNAFRTMWVSVGIIFPINMGIALFAVLNFDNIDIAALLLISILAYGLLIYLLINIAGTYSYLRTKFDQMREIENKLNPSFKLHSTYDEYRDKSRGLFLDFGKKVPLRYFFIVFCFVFYPGFWIYLLFLKITQIG